jgi:hypothetical protein
MALCHYFNSSIVALNFSSCWSNCWTLSSSSKVVQGCSVLSKKFATSLAYVLIISICRDACCSLLVVTSRVVDVDISFSSSISFLYPSSVCMIILICSSTLLIASCTLYGIFLNTSFSFCSRLSTCFFSSYVSSLTFSTTICRASLPSMVTCNFVTYTLACYCTSCVTLTYVVGKSACGQVDRPLRLDLNPRQKSAYHGH